MTSELKPVVAAILPEYVLSIHSDHGVAHWARVLENGQALADKTGADVEVVRLFAVFHDARRLTECQDPDHGQRGADLAAALRDEVFTLDDRAFNLLYKACEGHTRERTHPDVTIQTCWDADRLDLGRVGITPHPSRLCTETARDPKMIHWADGRARFRVVPDWISTQWGVEVTA